MELCALRSKIYFIRVQLLGSFGVFLSAFSSVDLILQYRMLIRPGKHPTWACSCVDSDIDLLVGILIEILETTEASNRILTEYCNVGLFSSVSRPFFFQPSAPSALQSCSCLAASGRTDRFEH